MPVVIADDFTGAAELGGVAWRYGLKAEVQAAVFKPTGSGVTMLDTDSRACTPEEAAARVTEAISTIADRAWVYKKVDSVLRGPVLAELVAASHRLKRPRVLLVPANPRLNRVVRGGRIFVNNEPLETTEFCNDPQYPRKSSDVLELLKSDIVEDVHLRTLGQSLPQRGIIIAEAAARKDLFEWAAKLDETFLPAGGADFFAAILENRGYRVRTTPTLPREDGKRVLFVCGSASSSTGKFLVAAESGGLPVFRLPSELREPGEASQRWHADLLKAAKQSKRLVIAIGQPLSPEPYVSAHVGNQLISAAKTLLRRDRFEEVYVEGGATASCLVREMGWHRLKVECEFAPGIVRLRAGTGAGEQITVKPGSYAWPASIYDPSRLSKENSYAGQLA